MAEWDKGGEGDIEVDKGRQKMEGGERRGMKTRIQIGLLLRQPLEDSVSQLLTLSNQSS